MPQAAGLGELAAGPALCFHHDGNDGLLSLILQFPEQGCELLKCSVFTYSLLKIMRIDSHSSKVSGHS